MQSCHTSFHILRDGEKKTEKRKNIRTLFFVIAYSSGIKIPKWFLFVFELNFAYCFPSRKHVRSRGPGSETGAYHGGIPDEKTMATTMKIRPATWDTQLQFLWKLRCSPASPGKCHDDSSFFLKCPCTKRSICCLLPFRCTSLNVIRDPYASAISNFQPNTPRAHHIMHHTFESRSLPTSNRLAARSLSNDSVS